MAKSNLDKPWHAINTYDRHGKYYYVDLIVSGKELLECYYHLTTRTWRHCGSDINIDATSITHWRPTANMPV